VLLGLLLGAEPGAVEAWLGMESPFLTGGRLRLGMDGDLLERLLGPAVRTLKPG
jgi:hypothetical protein